MFNALAGLFGRGQPVKYHPAYVAFMENQRIANEQAALDRILQRANITNVFERRCKIGWVRLKGDL